MNPEEEYETKLKGILTGQEEKDLLEVALWDLSLEECGGNEQVLMSLGDHNPLIEESVLIKRYYEYLVIAAKRKV